MSAQIDIEGLKEIRDGLKFARTMGLKSEAKDINKSAAQLVVDDALPNVPVGATGNLKRSVRALGSQRDGRAVAGRAKVPYAAAIHWGRIKGNVGWAPNNRMGVNIIAGRPFLWEAVQRSQGKIGDFYRDRLTDLLDRMTKGQVG